MTDNKKPTVVWRINGTDILRTNDPELKNIDEFNRTFTTYIEHAPVIELLDEVIRYHEDNDCGFDLDLMKKLRAFRGEG